MFLFMYNLNALPQSLQVYPNNLTNGKHQNYLLKGKKITYFVALYYNEGTIL